MYVDHVEGMICRNLRLGLVLSLDHTSRTYMTSCYTIIERPTHIPALIQHSRTRGKLLIPATILDTKKLESDRAALTPCPSTISSRLEASQWSLVGVETSRAELGLDRCGSLMQWAELGSPIWWAWKGGSVRLALSTSHKNSLGSDSF